MDTAAALDIELTGEENKDTDEPYMPREIVSHLPDFARRTLMSYTWVTHE
jgi:hypothetical protein